MPLFHAHGLLAALLTSLMAGASIVCLPGFSVPQFFVWLAEFHPTWYTAVPAIHQAILARAALHAEIITRCPLRFIRSASAPLQPQVLTKLESVFNTRVVEIYGATEVSGGAITCNPLPPRKRKIGSVGMPAGPEIAIMDEMGTLLPVGAIGEIVVRGATVMQGYYNNHMANRNAFTHGWFRTGDQGYIDIDGYLFLTGRLKEIINRGGEKIAPREVEEVLMEHPAVAEVTAFAVPHTELGEDIAVAIILRENASVTARQIRAFASAQLADFKVPRQVVFVDEIPTGATGKVQRIGLAQRLGVLASEQAQPEAKASSTVPRTPLEQAGAFVAPRTPLEVLLAEIWQDVLEVDRVGVYDNFFDLGGHSLLSMQVVTRVEKKLGLRIHPTELVLQTLGQLASACEAQMCPLQPLESLRLSHRLLRVLKGLVSRRTKCSLMTLFRG